METGLFPGYRGERPNLRMATPLILARKVWHNLRACLRKHRFYVIWDAFAGIGIDAMAASHAFQVTVLATEKDQRTYQWLCHNLRGSQDVIPYHGNAWTHPIEADLIFLDPPWGDAFQPTLPFDFFQEFRDLLLFMKEWAPFLVVKTPLLLGPTPPPWRPRYVYRSQKYRLQVWLFEHARRVDPLETVHPQNDGCQNAEGAPRIGQVAAQESPAGTLNDQPEQKQSTSTCHQLGQHQTPVGHEDRGPREKKCNVH